MLNYEYSKSYGNLIYESRKRKKFNAIRIIRNFRNFRKNNF